jgi:hypothetical protein
MDQLTLAFVLLCLLFVKHWFADFVVQFDYMVEQKGIYGAVGGIHHAGIHAALTAACFVPFMALPYCMVLGVIDGVAHYHIDWLKMRINRVRKLTITKGEFWMWLGADQLAHSLTYLALVYGVVH